MLGFFAHVRTRVGTPVGLRIQAFPFQEIVLDELQVGVVAELLMTKRSRYCPNTGLRMIELINVVTYACPVETSPGGCSETLLLGRQRQEPHVGPAYERYEMTERRCRPVDTTAAGLLRARGKQSTATSSGCRGPHASREVPGQEAEAEAEAEELGDSYLAFQEIVAASANDQKTSCSMRATAAPR
jgi:hypothetical protein